MEQPAPMPKPSISAAHSKVQGPSLPITDEFYDEDECMRRAIGAVEHMLLQTNSPSSGQHQNNPSNTNFANISYFSFEKVLNA